MAASKNSKGKRLNILWVIILIGSVPLLTAILILTIYSTRKMEQELEDSTYARLKACAVSVEKYFEWDVREDILCRDDVSYEFIDSLKKDNIELTFLKEMNDTSLRLLMRMETVRRNKGRCCNLENCPGGQGLPRRWCTDCRCRLLCILHTGVFRCR